MTVTFACIYAHMFGTISPSEHTMYNDVLNGREMYLKQTFMHVHMHFFSSSDYGFFHGGDD